MKKLIIYGIGDFAELMAYYFTSDTHYEVVAFSADPQYIAVDTLNSLPVVSFDTVQTEFPPKEYEMFVAVGYKNMRSRKRMFTDAKAKGYRCASYLSTKAIYDSSNNIGENCIILHGAILEPFAEIGDNSCVNSGAVICHHSLIGTDCFIAAKSLIGGFTIVNENSFIGFGATVLQKLTLAKETLVGANALVTKNTDESAMYVGSPAKKVSQHHENGIEIVD